MQPINRTVSSPPLVGSSQPTTPGDFKAAQGINEHSLVMLKRGIDQCLTEEMDRTLHQTNQIADIVSTSNRVMLSALQAVNRTLQTNNIVLSTHEPLPSGIEPLVQYAYQQTVTAYNRSFPELSIKAHDVELCLEDIEDTQQSIDHSESPLANIPPEQRWRMCVDPRVIDAIEQHVSGTRDNRLLCFVFDSQTAFLNGVLKGLGVSMMHLETPLNDDFLNELHRVCCDEQYGIEPQQPFSSGFGLTMGDNMTSAGREELLTFVRELRQSIPAYVAVENDAQFEHFQAAFKICRPGEAVPGPPEPDGDHVLIKHAHVTHGRLLMQANIFIEKYKEAMESTPDKTKCLEHIVDLCQRLERLHPFTDGNCRTICNVFLNHLLVRNDMPLTLLNDPNVLDGWSRDEVISEIETGWKRAEQYTQAASNPEYRY